MNWPTAHGDGTAGAIMVVLALMLVLLFKR